MKFVAVAEIVDFLRTEMMLVGLLWRLKFRQRGKVSVVVVVVVWCSSRIEMECLQKCFVAVRDCQTSRCQFFAVIGLEYLQTGSLSVVVV